MSNGEGGGFSYIEAMWSGWCAGFGLEDEIRDSVNISGARNSAFYARARAEFSYVKSSVELQMRRSI